MQNKGIKEKIEVDLNFEKSLDFTMYFTNAFGISFLASTMDLNYEMTRTSLSSLVLLLDMALTQQVRMGRKMPTGTLSGERAMKMMVVKEDLGDFCCCVRILIITLLVETDA